MLSLEVIRADCSTAGVLPPQALYSLGGIYSNAVASGKKYRIGHFNYIHGGRNYCFLQSMLTVGKTSPIDVVLNSNGTVYSINN